jgi:signal transduction histidine kinase
LLRNAIESGAANVTLSALVTASEIEINVADDGCGVAEADAHRLCDPFFTTRRSRGGAGLGLSITHSIIQEHGGRLDFVRTSGPGVTVRVILPRVFDERESDDVGST